MPRLSRFFVPALFLLGAWLRLIDLARPFRGMYAWNEAYYSIIAVNFTHYGWRQQWGPDGPLFTSNPLVPWLIAASFHHFGVHAWAGRLPFFACALISLAAIYGLARAVYPQRPALARWCLLFAATMPGLVFFSRNIQLDGPMAAAGLVGLWLAALSVQRSSRLALAGSVLAMALCVTLKYTGVLALPAWWVALGLHRRDWRRGIGLTLLTLLPAAFAIHWVTSLQAASGAAVHGLTTRSYFFRFNEWKPSAFVGALIATWNTQSTHWGPILWYPFLLGLPLIIPQMTQPRLRAYRLIPAMILPWFLQIAYPVSWVTNEYYDYFALYGIAFGLGVLADYSARTMATNRRNLRLPVWTGAFVVGLVIVSNLWEYHQTFHQSYFPFDVVGEATPYQSAKLVRQMDQDHAPILTDQSQTMFYANPDPAVTTHIWWRENEAAFDGAIRARQPQYVVVEYLPAPETVEALDAAHYRQIAPGAWERGWHTDEESE